MFARRIIQRTSRLFRVFLEIIHPNDIKSISDSIYSHRLVDVGDQRGDRRKWIYLFETVHAVLFFASLVDFLEPSRFPEFEVSNKFPYFKNTNSDKVR